MVYDTSAIDLNLNDKDSYCQCCFQPIPADEHFYSIFVTNVLLGDWGPGFPLFFEFMKKLNWLLVILTLVYFCPMAYFMF